MGLEIYQTGAMESCHTCLHRAMEEMLSNEVQGAGDGSTRKLITTYLTGRLKECCASNDTGVLTLTFSQASVDPPSFDKLGQGWIQALPGHRGFNFME